MLRGLGRDQTLFVAKLQESKALLADTTAFLELEEKKIVDLVDKKYPPRPFASGKGGAVDGGSHSGQFTAEVDNAISGLKSLLRELDNGLQFSKRVQEDLNRK